MEQQVALTNARNSQAYLIRTPPVGLAQQDALTVPALQCVSTAHILFQDSMAYPIGSPLPALHREQPEDSPAI